MVTMITGYLLPWLHSVRPRLARLAPAGTFAEGLVCRILTIMSGSLATIVSLRVLDPSESFGFEAAAMVRPLVKVVFTVA